MRINRFCKARAILKGTRGETLMEGIISILVFTILLASVTMMIMVSLGITTRATILADEMQDAANATLTGADAPPGTEVVPTDFVEIKFTHPDLESLEINVKINKVVDENNPDTVFFIAFAPQ